jgi:hypothetical protein
LQFRIVNGRRHPPAVLFSAAATCGATARDHARARVVAPVWNCYIRAMMPVPAASTIRATTRLHRIVLTDHVRLPGRFFGRLTAAIQAGL